MQCERESRAAEQCCKRECKLKIARRLEGKLLAVQISMRGDWRSKNPDFAAVRVLEKHKVLTVELSPHGFETERAQVVKDPRQNNRCGPGETQQWQRLSIGAEQERCV